MFVYISQTRLGTSLHCYIVTGIHCDCRLYFIVVMMFLHGSGGDCAAGLIMSKNRFKSLQKDEIVVCVVNKIDANCYASNSPQMAPCSIYWAYKPNR